MKQEIMIGTSAGLYVINGSKRVEAEGHAFRSIAGRDSMWWAAVDDGQLWRSEDHGPWTEVASLDGLRANCVLPTAAGLFVGSSEAHLFRLSEDSLKPVQSFEEAEGRESWTTPWGGPPDVRAIAEDPAGNLFVNVHVGGVVRSRDGGGAWEPTIDMNADVHQIIVEPRTGMLFAPAARGLAVSTDGGATWQTETEGLHAAYLRAVAVAGETLLVSASTGPRTDHAAVYRRPLQGSATFQRCEEGLPERFPSNIDTFCLSSSGPMVAIGTAEGSVYLSQDEGASWAVHADGLPPVRCVAFS